MIGAVTARMVPVLRLRVIEAESQPFLLAGLGQFGDKIAFVRAGADAVEIADLRIKKARSRRDVWL